MKSRTAIAATLLVGAVVPASAQSTPGTSPTYFDGMAAPAAAEFQSAVAGPTLVAKPPSEPSYSTGALAAPPRTESMAARPTAVTATPEPAALMLLATGLLGVGGLVRRRRNA